MLQFFDRCSLFCYFRTNDIMYMSFANGYQLLVVGGPQNRVKNNLVTNIFSYCKRGFGDPKKVPATQKWVAIYMLRNITVKNRQNNSSRATSKPQTWSCLTREFWKCHQLSHYVTRKFLVTIFKFNFYNYQLKQFWLRLKAWCCQKMSFITKS
jgi:hypothetical protein